MALFESKSKEAQSQLETELLNVEDTDRMFLKASFITVAVWIFCICLVYSSSPPTEKLEGTEREAAAIAFWMLFVIFIVVWLITSWPTNKTSISGILVASLTVQTIAMITNALLAWYPTPVMMDEMTGARVFVLRWCEWAPLAGLKTFLSEAVDLPKANKGLRTHVVSSILQSIACFGGLLLPFCSTSPFAWGMCLAQAFTCYMFIYPRVYTKYCNLLETPRGSCLAEQEYYDRIKFAYNLILTCAIVWTILTCFYFLNISCIRWLPPDHSLRTPALAMVLDTIFDVIAKGIYMALIIDVHFQVYEPQGRARRQLGELRRLMSVLWDNVSDVLVISIAQDKKTTTVLSPSYKAIFGHDDIPEDIRKCDSAAMMLTVTEDQKVSGACFINSALDFATLELPKLSEVRIDSSLVQRANQLIQTAWKNVPTDSNQLIEHTLNSKSGDDIHCEIKVSRHLSHSLIAVVRDVTERQLRFVAEKTAHEQTLARQRDAQSINRFTRHEVKNGLLAGIELCESLQKATEDLQDHASKYRDTFAHACALSIEVGEDLEGFQQKMNKFTRELDTQLHETLETVLAEAMARDVIHEVYIPRVENCKIHVLLARSSLDMGSGRFPLHFDPPDMPELRLDPQLILYIHRNAVSNACKYGFPGGEVSTFVKYNPFDKELEISVVNEPGEGHDEIMMLGEDASQFVFMQGKRLHTHLSGEMKVSAGDGCWIMSKCAKTMNGKCRIRFMEESTVFTFRCPAQVHKHPKETDPTFAVPENTWGIALDDSKIQRKLMHKILIHAGIDESRILVLGGCPEEVQDLAGQVDDLLEENPTSKFLMLVDENLDFPGKVVLSGSLAVQEILEALPKRAETRILALVRSANDSAQDIALYKERTHGFFPKAPMRKDRVCEILAPLWTDRFGVEDDDESDDDSSESPVSIQGEFIRSVQTIDSMLCEDFEWPQVWKVLHTIKGDCQALGILPRAVSIVESLRGPEMPTNFMPKWRQLRKVVINGTSELKDLEAL